MSKYVVFLDVDGVFCSTRVHMGYAVENSVMWDQFDPVAIAFMNYIHDNHDVEFVLMSTWKNGIDVDHVMAVHWIISCFRNAGFRGHIPHLGWKTGAVHDPKYNRLDGRAHEVADYLQQYGPYEDFLLFDDANYRFDEVLKVKRWVRTDPQDGMLTKHMLKAKSLMGSWEKKNATIPTDASDPKGSQHAQGQDSSSSCSRLIESDAGESPEFECC